MKKSLFEQVILYDYRYLVGYGLLLLVGLYSLFWRLGSLVPGLSRYEAEYLNRFDQGIDSIAANPVYWPHKLLTQISVEFLGNNELAWRLPSAGLAAIGLLAFFFIIRHRFKGRVAMVGILLLATSSWWLGVARLARPEILIPVMMLLIVLLARFTLENHSGWWLVVLGGVVGIAFYIPLLPYVLIIAATVSYSLIRRFAAEIPAKWIWLFFAVLTVVIGPLLVAVLEDPSIWRELLVWPDQLPTLDGFLQNIQATLASVFWSAQDFPVLNLGTLPYLDLFTVAMVVLGFYYLDHEVSRSLTQFLLFGLLGLLLVMNLDPEPSRHAVLIPFIYTLVSAGIVMLFSQWYEIFPRNPVARMAAFLPTMLLLGAVVWYHHTRYFVAWPSSSDVISTFPPLRPAIGRWLQEVKAGSSGVILATPDEVPIAQAALRLRPELQVTTVGTAALGQPNLAVTDDAYRQLDRESLRQAREAHLAPLVSPWRTQPVVLWYTTGP